MTRYEQSLAACEDSGQRGVAAYLRDLKASHDNLIKAFGIRCECEKCQNYLQAALKAAEALR